MASSLEVADILRRHGAAYRAAHAGHLSLAQLKVMSAIETCRTAALGGHIDACDDCGFVRIAYNSCRNRHCPKCQGAAARTWLAEREADLLPVGYFHVVFTLPAEVAAIAFHNKAAVYDLLFKTASETMLTIAADPHHLDVVRPVYLPPERRESRTQSPFFPTENHVLRCQLSFDQNSEPGSSDPAKDRSFSLDDLFVWAGGLAIFLKGMNRHGQPMVTPYEATTLSAKLRRFSRSKRFSDIVGTPDNHTGHAEDIESALLAVIRSRVQELKSTDQTDWAIVLAKLLDRL